MLLELTSVMSPIITGLISKRNKSNSTNTEIAQKQEETQLKIALTQIEAQAKLEKRRQIHQDDLEMSQQQFQERMGFLGFQQKVSLEQARQEFQLRLQSLDHEHQQAIEQFKAEINVAINQKNLNFQQWKFEQEMRLQQQLAADNRETQLIIAEEQRKTAQALPEINKIFENWPLRITPSQIINAQKGSGPIPLCVLISPPKVDSDKHENTKNFPNIEESLASGLRKLLNNDYSLNDKYRPIELLDGAWDSNRFHGGSSIKVLFSMLKSEPMLVLESKVMLNDINLKVAYWGLGQEEDSKYFYQEILKIPFKKILDEAAKARALSSKTDQINDEDWQALYQVLITTHCLVTAWIADIHHLIHYNVPPKLPELLPELLSNDEFNLLPLSEIVTAIVAGYKNTFKALEIEQPHWVPELALDLGLSLASLEDKKFANEQIHDSITAFLRSRQCTDLKVIDNHEQLKNILVYGDNDYFEKLEKLISLMGKENVIPEANKLLQAWSEIAPVSNIVLDKIPVTKSIHQQGETMLNKLFKKKTESIHQEEETMSNTQQTEDHTQQTEDQTQQIKEILQNKYEQIEDYYNDWSEFMDKTTELLRNPESEETKSIVKTNDDFKEAIDKFEDEIIDNPRITIATTGTTSGGKSSLVNLLCGAEIMPTSVQEMSAGTVIIDHHPTESSLKIPPIEGLDEYCVSGSDLSAKEISERLKTVMDAYRQLVQENREPPAPRIEVQYPTRLGMNPELLGLPDNCKLRILDLPGLNAVADDHNRQVIRNEIEQALCLVTYNSAETDRKKQEQLLKEVISGVKEAGGSPTRMLFILNKIDVFSQTGEDTKKFITEIKEKIRTSVARELPEYKEDAKKLQTQALSSLPALYACQALNDSAEEDVSLEALKKIDKSFGFLIPEEVLEYLPRKISKWEKNYSKVAEGVWKESYGSDFDEKLSNHIKDNLPQLLLPPFLMGVTDMGGKALTNADQIINAQLNATGERYEEECKRLESIEENLQELRDDSKQELEEIVYFYEDGDIIEQLMDMASKLEETYNLADSCLVPLYNWTNELGQGIEEFFDCINQAIIDNTKPQGELIESLPPQKRKELFQVLDDLAYSGYDDYAEYGGYFEANTSAEKTVLKNMNRKLNTLSGVLAHVLSQILERIAEREMGRIVDSLKILTEGYANFISEEAQKIAPDLAGLTITPSELSQVNHTLKLNFKFTAGFSIDKNKEKNVKISEKQVAAGEERNWKTLWVGKKTVYKTEVIYEKRNYDVAEIPAITEIFSNLIEQARDSRQKSEEKMTDWLDAQIKELLNNIEEYQEELLEKYRSHLDNAMEQAKAEDKEEISQKWEPMANKLVNLQNKFADIKVV